MFYDISVLSEVFHPRAAAFQVPPLLGHAASETVCIIYDLSVK